MNRLLVSISFLKHTEGKLEENSATTKKTRIYKLSCEDKFPLTSSSAVVRIARTGCSTLRLVQRSLERRTKRAPVVRHVFSPNRLSEGSPGRAETENTGVQRRRFSVDLTHSTDTCRSL